MLGVGASNEDTSRPRLAQSRADETLLYSESTAGKLVGAVFALMGLGLLVGIVGGFRALHGRHGFS
jgi:hypothetical protein